MELHANREPFECVRVGDAIETDVKHPQPGVVRVRLLTPEACAMGNRLLMDRTSGWRPARQPAIDEGMDNEAARAVRTPATLHPACPRVLPQSVTARAG